MNAIVGKPFAQVIDKLHAARLHATAPRVAVLQALQSQAEHWFSTEAIYRLLLDQGMDVGVGTLYRVMNEMTSRGLLMRQINENRKRFFRLHPGNQALHRIVCRETGRLLAETDDISPGHVTNILRGQGLMLTDAPMTVQVQCIQERDEAC